MNIRPAAALVLGCLSAALPAPAAEAQEGAPPRLTVEIAPSRASVGDLVEASLVLDADSELPSEPVFPNWQRHWGTAEIRDVGAVQKTTTGERARYIQKLHLASFRPGEVTLPAAVVEVETPEGDVGQVTAEATVFEIVSVLPPEGEEGLDPKPPESPRALAMGRAFWWTAGILAAFALGLLAVVLRRRSPRPTYEGTVLDPWEALEQALARLAAASDPETVFTGLSLELRRYLGRCLAFPAAESTTTELRRRLLRSGLPSSICGDVVKLLVEADSVKFAKQRPASDRLNRCLDEARGAASEVREFLRPAKAEDDEERAA